MIYQDRVVATSDERTNALVVRGPESVHNQIEKILQIIDQPNNTKELSVIKINHVPATDMAAIMQNLIIYRQKTNPGICVADPKTNKIIICEEPKFIKEMEKLVALIDSKPEYKSPAFVLKLKNARNDRLADILNKISR